MRTLATIRKIDAISPIPNADAIEVATVGGWNVVIRKGEFSVNEKVIFVEIDSWIPHDLAPFLSKGQEPKEYNGVKGNRLRTTRLRGQLSQGLLLPVSYAIQDDVNGVEYPFIEESNITELLGIQKWETPIPAQLAGEVRGIFPNDIPKTDQERVQNLADKLPEWGNLKFEVTEKLDGSSCTMYLDFDGDFHVCSRNLDLKPSETNSFWRAARKYDIRNKMLFNNLSGYALQGELIGPGIQGNPYKLRDIEFHVFDIYSVRHGNYIPSAPRQHICKNLGLDHVQQYLKEERLSVHELSEKLGVSRCSVQRYIVLLRERGLVRVAEYSRVNPGKGGCSTPLYALGKRNAPRPVPLTDCERAARSRDKHRAQVNAKKRAVRAKASGKEVPLMTRMLRSLGFL